MLIIRCIWFIMFSKFDFISPSKLDTSKIMVGFNPYVSVLDNYNNSRYGISELIPLIAKVATRFKMIHLQLYNEYFKPRSKPRAYISQVPKSLMLAPFAAATYNCLPTTTNKIEVFIEIDQDYISSKCSCDEFYLKLHPVLALAERANLLCRGTISTILLEKYCTNSSCSLPESSTKKLQEALKFRVNYIWGLSRFYSYDSKLSLIDQGQYNSVDILKVNFANFAAYLDPNSTAFKIYNYKNNTRNQLKLIRNFIPSNIGVRTISNMSSLVSRWQDILTQPSDIYFISYAFDSYENGHELGYGWWYLLKDPGSTNTTEFGFEEKITVAKRVDNEESPKNYIWLKENYRFNANTTGIISHSVSEFEYSEYYNFCRIMAVEPFNISELQSILTKTQNITKTKSCGSGRHVYVLPFLNEIGTKIESNFGVYNIKDVQIQLRQGFACPLDICGKFSNSDKASDKLSGQLRNLTNQVFIFYFNDRYNSIRVGTTRLFRQRIVMFKKCREIVEGFGRENVEIAFVSLGYIMVEKFNNSVKAIQEYVKYVYLLSDWAKKENNIVVGIGMLEDKEIGSKFSNRKSSYVGFYTYNNVSQVYTPKNVQALELSQLRFPEPVKNNTSYEKTGMLNSYQFFIVLSLLVVISVTIISIATSLTLRYYKNNNVSKIEIEEFFNGKNCNNAVKKLSYDKEKYEISKEKFRVELGTPLGSGEFGVVYHGNIDTSSGEIRVAVKTSNPKKIHTTQTSGLLSEIKVLAHVGKHPNIIELLGANTKQLRKGKVYVFLEFCHLGSLKNILEDIRLPMNSCIHETNFDTLTNKNEYINLRARNSIILDAALSQDLYRWSTEICNGMAFLAEKHVVHADLATRNVLLNLRRVAKICDFGLSRRMYNDTNYVKTQQEPLPWKWMAPEALRDMEFNEKTDIWAYGVTLWEIYSLGSTPYAGLSWDPNFSQMLEQGLQLSEPKYCERDMFSRMQKSWLINPDRRPNFSEMLSTLESID